jgi:hypothetical protein
MATGIKYDSEFRKRGAQLYVERRAGHQEESLAAATRQVAGIMHMPWIPSAPRRGMAAGGGGPGITSEVAAGLQG